MGSSRPWRSTHTRVRGGATPAAGHVHQRAATSDVELGSTVRECYDFRHDRNRRANRFEAVEVERDGAQRAGVGVHQMAAGDVVCLATARHQDFWRRAQVSEVENRHARGVYSARRRRDSKEDGLTTGEELWPDVVAFSALAARRRQDRLLARRSMRPAADPVAGAAVAKMMLPRAPTSGHDLHFESREGYGCPAGDGDFLEGDRTRLDKTYPFSVRRGEGSTW